MATTLVAPVLLFLLIVFSGCTSTGTTTGSGLGDTTTVAPISTTVAPTDGVSSSTTVPPQSSTQAQRLSPPTGTFSTCRDCHAFLDPKNNDRGILTDAFGHEKHLTRGAECADCHRLPVHQPTVIRRPSMVECYTCHQDAPGAKAPATCSLCHPPDFNRLPSYHTQEFFAGGHSKRVAQTGTAECFSCHTGNETTFCLKCHGLPMPHPTGWGSAPTGGPGAHVARVYAEPGICVRCHQNRVAPPAGCYGGECHGE